jgi:hypothetical protein
MRIRVTQREIAQGVQANSFHCPVARAIERPFKVAAVWVREIIIAGKAGRKESYVTPSEVQDFIERYDSAVLEFDSPKPFSSPLDQAS